MWNRRKKNMMTRLTQIFGIEPTGDHELRNEEIGYFVTYAPKEKTVEIRINTFVNPYTQDMEKVYQERIDRISAFTEVCEDKTILDMVNIQANEPSKLGSMQIVVTIEESWATDDVLTRLKDIIYQIHSEQVPNESLVWFKSEYNDNICYFEGNMWWYPKRAVIMGEEEYERLDFSDEMNYDEEMWYIVEGEYDQMESYDSFELISSQEFQNIWEKTGKSKTIKEW